MLPNAPLTDLLTAQPPLNAGLVTPPNPLDVALNPSLSSSNAIAEPIVPTLSPISRVPLSILARFGLTDPNPRPIAPGFPPNWQVVGLPRAVPTPTPAVAASPIVARTVPTPIAAVPPIV
jgi:hypothetical protein